MRTPLLVLALLVFPCVASAQTIGDVVQLATAIGAEQRKCAAGNNTCLLPLIRLGEKAITLSADALSPSNDPCIAKLKKDLSDASCAAIAEKRWHTIMLSGEHAASYRTLKQAYEDEVVKRKRNYPEK